MVLGEAATRRVPPTPPAWPAALRLHAAAGSGTAPPGRGAINRPCPCAPTPLAPPPAATGRPGNRRRTPAAHACPGPREPHHTHAGVHAAWTAPPPPTPHPPPERGGPGDQELAAAPSVRRRKASSDERSATASRGTTCPGAAAAAGGARGGVGGGGSGMCGVCVCVYGKGGRARSREKAEAQARPDARQAAAATAAGGHELPLVLHAHTLPALIHAPPPRMHPLANPSTQPRIRRPHTTQTLRVAQHERRLKATSQLLAPRPQEVRVANDVARGHRGRPKWPRRRVQCRVPAVPAPRAADQHDALEARHGLGAQREGERAECNAQQACMRGRGVAQEPNVRGGTRGGCRDT